VRYSIIYRTSLEEARNAIISAGGRNLKELPLVSQIICDLEEDQAERLKAHPGLSAKKLRKAKVLELRQSPQQEAPYASWQAGAASLFLHFREVIKPPITGATSTIVFLDTGIRETHKTLSGKIVYSKDFTGSPKGAEDIFDHGTGVCFLAIGGRHTLGEESGVAPGAWGMNIKVIGDDGTGNEEDIIDGINEVISLRDDAVTKGLPPEDPMYPTIINCSWGMPDDGDPESPIRVACRKAIEKELEVVAACGNEGPEPRTITIPAVDPHVWAVGAVTFVPFRIWHYSSRGPTLEGIIKPDIVFYGINILTASGKSDDSFIPKAGTSFSSPLIAGLGTLAAEGYTRITGIRIMPPLAWQVIPLIARKPPEAPRQKDPDYGWGMPMGDLAINLIRLGRFGMPDISGVLSATMMTLMVGMMGRFLRRGK